MDEILELLERRAEMRSMSNQLFMKNYSNDSMNNCPKHDNYWLLHANTVSADIPELIRLINGTHPLS